MKPLVKLIVENRSSIPNYVAQIQSVFGDAITLRSFGMDDPQAYDPEKNEIILTVAYSAENFAEVKRSRLRGKDLISVELCLQSRTLLQLNAYPKGTRAFVVNVSKYMAEETIAQLRQAGYGHIAFVPFYPGATEESQITLAITPGEAPLAPSCATEIVDLGPRQINVVAMIELAAKTGCLEVLKTRRFFEYFERQHTTSAGVSILVEQNQVLGQRLSALVQLFSPGLIGLDTQNNVFDCNFQAANLVGKSRGDLLREDASSLFPQELIDRCRAQLLPVSKRFGGDHDTGSMQMIPITHGTQYLGAYITVRPTETAADAGHMKQDVVSGHAAKYTFSDICGSSPQITQTVELARKMARTDSSVLITGESGTGKELFAHAIHNSSLRAEAPFIAINCAALPDTLLESELFGYEEGAFTGAKKGGKKGLFELADSGTIFLDEIEGMAPSTQLKLLRVIQEREIMRVGGDQVISIDVRVISASNQDLIPLMESGKFRRDLYYRVSTLPLDLPPLRHRKEDIIPLMEEFKNTLRLTFVLTEEAKSLLQHYNWPGNIRELRNCAEYLGCQNIAVIDVENLPYTIRSAAIPHSSETVSRRIETEILQILAGQSAGRQQLQRQLSRAGYAVTIGQLRRTLEHMKTLGWVAPGVGRGGTSLTPQGMQEYQNRQKRA